MRKRRLNAVLSIILTSVFALPVFGWHDEGHRLTAYVAWQRMTPQTREAVIKILRAAPEDAQLSTFYSVYGGEPEALKRLEFFMFVPTWADMIRISGFPVRSRKYNRSNWHYYDTFWKRTDGKVEILSAMEEGGEALKRLEEAEKTMRDPKANNADKAIAIAWMMHLTGDLHQPLHNSARVTDREPKGDMGGNLFLLTPEGTPRESQLNLHSFWDGILLRNVPIKSGQCVREYITSLGGKIMKKHPYQKFAADLKVGQYPEWHKSGLDLAMNVVFSPDLVRFQMPSEKYRKKAFALSERQLALAGYRIGELLNNIFGAAAPVTPS